MDEARNENIVRQTTTTADIKFQQTTPEYKQIGWICPVCGRVLSPFTSVCPCKDKWEITC